MKPPFVFSSFSLLAVSVGLLVLGAETAMLLGNYFSGSDITMNAVWIVGALAVTSYVIIRAYVRAK